MTQKSRIAIPLCLSALTFVAYRVPNSSCRIIKREREGKREKERNLEQGFLYVRATFDLKIPSPEPGGQRITGD